MLLVYSFLLCPQRYNFEFVQLLQNSTNYLLLIDEKMNSEYNVFAGIRAPSERKETNEKYIRKYRAFFICIHKNIS